LDIEREYCEYCGSHTLAKVSVYISENGEISYFDNPKRRINLRGTKYSIPKPKFGRNNKDLVLREDELLTGQKAINIRDAKQAK
jgi:RNA-binding protein NOB1